MYPSLLQQLHCHHKNTGAFIAACGKKEEEHLTILRQRADQRGIPYRILDGDQARKEEPHLSDAVTKVIDFYTTEVIYPWEAALRCMENAVNNGTKLYLNTEVTGIEKTDTGYRIISNDMTLDTAMVINCAGVNAPLTDIGIMKSYREKGNTMSWTMTVNRSGISYSRYQDLQEKVYLRYLLFTAIP